MAIGSNLDWLFHLIGAVLGAAAVFILIWALFRDRSRGRRRCPKCWYDMAGTPGLRCPECGRIARLEQHLFRTRRRWKRVVGAALLMLVSAAIAAVPTYRDGWQRLVPTTALALIAPAEDPSSASINSWMRATLVSGVVIGPNGAIVRSGSLLGGQGATIGETLTDELWRRLREGTIAGWQGRAFIKRYLSAHPCDFAGHVAIPDRWPIGVPLLVQTSTMLPASFSENLIATYLRLPGGSTEIATPDTAHVDAVPTIGEGVEIQIELRRGRMVLYRTSITLPCELRPDDENLLDRVSGEPWDSRVAAALSPKMAWGPTNRGYFVTRDRTSAEKWSVLDLGIAFDIEMREAGKVLARGQGAAEWNRPVWKDWEDIAPEWQPGGLERVIADKKGLTFHVQGIPAAARRQYLEWPWGKRPACWTGEFEVSVPVE